MEERKMSITGEIKKEKSTKEYFELELISASDLRLFNIDRKKFHKEKILKEPRIEEYNRAIIIGSLTHLMVFEPHEFDNRYMMSICQEPPTGLVLAFTEALYRHSCANMREDGAINAEFKDLVQLAYQESGFKITLEAALKKFKETGQEYYDQLLQAKQKNLSVVCIDDVNIASKITETLKSDRFVGHYFNNIDYCELKVDGFEVDGLEMKSMIDKIIPNHEEKTLQPIDLKVVYDNQQFFREYFLKKQAYIQAYIYDQAVKSRKIDLGFDYSEYKILPIKFICADSGCFFSPLIYSLSEKDLENAYLGFKENGREYLGVKDLIYDMIWAKKSNIWNISKRDWENKGIKDLTVY